MTSSRLLTETEVAERLRTSPRNVRRLRMEGRIRYLPGRPPKIDEDDLAAYIEAQKCQGSIFVAQTTGMTTFSGPIDAEASAKAWARKKWDKRRSALLRG